MPSEEVDEDLDGRRWKSAKWHVSKLAIGFVSSSHPQESRDGGAVQ